jgi:hypothetical protein
MKILLIIGSLLSIMSGLLIAFTVYACNYVTHSCFDISLNIPLILFFTGIACIITDMTEDDKVIEV